MAGSSSVAHVPKRKRLERERERERGREREPIGRREERERERERGEMRQRVATIDCKGAPLDSSATHIWRNRPGQAAPSGMGC